MSQIVKLRRSSVSGQKPTNANLQLGELALNTTDGKVYMAKSGSLGPSVEELISTNTVNTGSIFLVGSITASSFSGSAIGLYDVPFRITGSDVDGNQSDKTFTKLHFDSDTGLNVSESAPGTAFISIGSHFKDIFVSGSPLLSATGSDAFEVIGAGGLGITTSITDTNGNGYIKELTISATSLSSSLNNRMDTITGSITNLSSSFDSRINSITASSGGVSAIYIGDEGSTQGTASYFDFIGSGVSATVNAGTASITINGGGGGSAIQGASQTYTQSTNAVTWSIDHSINSRTPVVEIYDNNYNVIIPTGIYNPGAYQTLVYFDVPQRGYAIISTGGGLTVDGANAILDQSSSSSTWTFNHNLGTKYPVFNIFDSNDDVIIPQRIHVVDENTAVIYFSSARSGKAVASVGGDVVNSDSSSFSVSSSFATNANFLDGKDSTQFATTSSNVFVGNQNFNSNVSITGSLTSPSITGSLFGTASWALNAITSSHAVTAFSSSYALTASYADNITISGSISNLNYIDFDLSSSFADAIGRLGYDNGEGTLTLGLAGGNIGLKIGTDLYQYVYNNTTSSMTLGQVVFVSGSQGNRIAVKLASATAEQGSANTLGFVAETIPAGSEGWVMTEGNLRKLNTVGLTGGRLIFLGTTPGTYTQTPPTAPNHGVRLGYAERINSTVGSIYVKIDNGYEIGELHDLVDNTTSSSFGDLLVKSGSVWTNSKQLTGSYVITGSQTIIGSQTVSGSMTILNNLTVFGSSSFVYVTSSQLAVSASTISVNVFEPVERFGGLKVYDSGSSNATSSLLWDSLHNRWIYQNVSGAAYSGGILLAGPKNTGSLGDEIGLIDGRIVKSVGGDHLDNSIISETGTTITIDGNLTASSLTGSINFNNLTNVPSLVSGSSQISYSGLTGIPSGIVSSSSQLTSSYDARYVLSGSITQTTWDNIANKPSGIVSGSDQLTGSYDTRYVLSGSITQTTWDNIANKPNNIVSSSTQISAFGFLQTSSFNTFTSSYTTGSFTGSFTGSLFGTASYAMFALSASNAPGFTTNMTQSSAATTWSFVHNLNTRNPIVQVYDSSYNQIVPNEIIGINESTAEIRFDYSQAGYAVASNGGGLYITGSTSRINQTSNATTWSFTHNLGTKYPSFEVFDSSDNVIIPAGIKATTINTAEIYFATPTSGVAIANFSGVNGFQENSVTSSFSLATKWNTIQDNPITGSLTSATAGTTSTILSVSTGSYYGAFFDYVAVSGSNSRAGTVMSTWNGSSVVYNESTTNDIGNTNEVTMSVDLSGTNVRLRATNTNQWSVRSLVRLI